MRTRYGPLPLMAALMVLATLAILLLPTTGAEEVTWGNTDVTTAEEYEGLVINLDGNLSVDAGGALTIRDSVIAVGDASPDAHTITVEEGGELQLVNVSVTVKGGTFGFVVRGTYTHRNGLVEGLSGNGPGVMAPGGLVVEGTGFVDLENVDLSTTEGSVVLAKDGSSLSVVNGSLFAPRTVLHITGTASAEMDGTLLRADLGSSLVRLEDGAALFAVGCDLTSDDVVDEVTRNQAVLLEGSGTEALLEDCVMRVRELAEVNGGRLEVMDGSFIPGIPRSLPDLLAFEAYVGIRGIYLGDVNVTGGTFWLHDVHYMTGEVRGGTEMSCVGRMPPLGTLATDVTLHQYYWTDFQLRNATGVTVEDLDLNILTSTGELVLEARSGVNGWVRHVPIAAWTLEGDVFGYEPSHKVEFAGPEYQITNLQVFDNGTVILEDLPDSRDLVLTTSSVRPSSSAPRENRTFDLVVDGAVLIPYPWQAGQTFIDLFIDGKFVERQVVPLTSREDVRFRDISLKKGQHEFRVLVDPTNDVKEVNEGGNNEVRLVLDVAPADGGTGDLVDLTIAITGSADSQGNEGDVLLPGVVFINYEARAVGAKTWLRDVTASLRVDGISYATEVIDLIIQDGSDFIYRGQLEVNLPRGEYTITVVIDPEDGIDEEFEQNNQDSMVLTLTPDADSGFNLDPVCCSAIAMVALVFTMFVVNAYSTKRQREASSEMVAETVGYPESGYSGQAGYGSGTVRPPVVARPPGKTPVSLDDQYQVDQLDRSMESYYGDKGITGSATDRILGYQAPSASQTRYKAPNLRCPRCNGSEITAFSDGSAKCQSCKKIFYPKRR